MKKWPATAESGGPTWGIDFIRYTTLTQNNAGNKPRKEIEMKNLISIILEALGVATVFAAMFFIILVSVDTLGFMSTYGVGIATVVVISIISIGFALVEVAGMMYEAE